MLQYSFYGPADVSFANPEYSVTPELLLCIPFLKLHHVSCLLNFGYSQSFKRKTPAGVWLHAHVPPRMGSVGSVQCITPSANLVKKVSSVRTFPNLPAMITFDKNPNFFAIVMWVYSCCFCTWFPSGPSIIWHTSGLSYVQNKSLLSSLPGATVLQVLFPTF